MENRIKLYKQSSYCAEFCGKILVFGCGAICRAFLPILSKLVRYNDLTVIDKLDNRSHIKYYLSKGVKYEQIEITKENYKNILNSRLSTGDILVDIAYDIGTYELLEWCRDNGVMFFNMSVEEFDRVATNHKTPQDFTLYSRNQKIRNLAKEGSATAIIDSGENPGQISCFAKRAIVDIVRAKYLNNPSIAKERRDKIKYYLDNRYLKHLAHEIGVQVIHITEKDTQITNIPKKPGEYVNSWSVAGLAEEVSAPAELGWGTHEKTLPYNAFTHDKGEKNQICLRIRGCNKLIQSWTYQGNFIGMLIRHGESYSISSRLTLYPSDVKNPRSYLHDPLRNTDKDEVAIYRPTVYFVFLPPDSGMASIHELRENRYILSNNVRNMYDDIISGMDEIGCLVMGKEFGAWWLGTSLDIEETRKLIDVRNNNISVSTIQAAGSIVSAIIYAIKNPNCGICFVDDIDYEEYSKIADMFQGPINSCEVKSDIIKKIIDGGCQFSDYEIDLNVL